MLGRSGGPHAFRLRISEQKPNKVHVQLAPDRNFHNQHSTFCHESLKLTFTAGIQGREEKKPQFSKAVPSHSHTWISTLPQSIWVSLNMKWLALEANSKTHVPGTEKPLAHGSLPATSRQTELSGAGAFKGQVPAFPHLIYLPLREFKPKGGVSGF